MLDEDDEAVYRTLKDIEFSKYHVYPEGYMVRMSPADAADRGIKTGDRVLVYNQFGEVEITAYVSSKLLPGTVSIAHGEWSKFDHVRKSKLMPYGIDTAGNCNMLIGDTHLPHIVGALLTAGLVEIRKVGE